MINNAYSELVQALREKGYNTEADELNFKETPERCERAFHEFFWDKQTITDNLNRHLKSDFPMRGDCGIVIADCEVISMCPHHLLSVKYNIYVGYLPINNSKVLGTSKLVRICDTLARRPVLQEQLLKDITATLYAEDNDSEFPMFESAGSFCIMNAQHSCMSTRGIKMNSSVRGASLRGAFLENDNLKDEAYKLCSMFRSNL